ncbi:OmpA family protein [Pararobbsia silviterrae]|uniref:OmpA family protein n=1 Tax=Pararobbsia silviterrae TaxID=1792498 RepID=UPI001313EA29|nr:OmpA family protein [Pararobbsia silviterrae]
MGNTLSRMGVAVMASALLGACSYFGAQKEPVAVVNPTPPKDPWQTIKADLASDASGAALTTSTLDDGSLKVNLPADASFDKGSSAIKVGTQPSLYVLSQMLSRHPEVRVELIGYSDNSGDADFNVELSKNRARSVSEYIVAHGIDASRITVEGRGDADPVDDNNSAAGRARNRRVEIHLTQTP